MKKLWDLMGAASGAETEVYENLSACYSEPHRVYHTLAHIAACLAEFDRARHFASRPLEIETAIWFHDAIYDTTASDNEEKSAELAFNILTRHKVSESVAKCVSGLVLATKHGESPSDGDTKLIVDIDLSILGRPDEEFDTYEEQIGLEYRHVPKVLFRTARADILKGFLSRDTIYLTDFFRNRYEKRARKNLERSIRRLGGKRQ